MMYCSAEFRHELIGTIYLGRFYGSSGIFTVTRTQDSMPGVPQAVQQGSNTTALLYLRSRIDHPNPTVSPSLGRTLKDPRYATRYFSTTCKVVAITYAYIKLVGAQRDLMDTPEYDSLSLRHKMRWWARQVQWLKEVWSLILERNRIAGHLFRNLVLVLVEERKAIRGIIWDVLEDCTLGRSQA